MSEQGNGPDGDEPGHEQGRRRASRVGGGSSAGPAVPAVDRVFHTLRLWLSRALS